MEVYVAIIVSIAAIVISFWAVLISRSQTKIAEKDLTLTAYQNAVQSIIDLKGTFAATPEIFEAQIKSNPEMRNFIPEEMRDNIPTFLAFAGGMWRFSYVYSVMQRGPEVGLTAGECEGLEKEMLLWLQDVPGFYEVYRTHTHVLKRHNPAFLTFLRCKVYNKAFFERKGLPPLPEENEPPCTE